MWTPTVCCISAFACRGDLRKQATDLSRISAQAEPGLGSAFPVSAFASAECSNDAFQDLVDTAFAGHPYQRSLALVEVDHWRRLLLVDMQAVGDRLRIVIGTPLGLGTPSKVSSATSNCNAFSTGSSSRCSNWSSACA